MCRALCVPCVRGSLRCAVQKCNKKIVSGLIRRSCKPWLKLNQPVGGCRSTAFHESHSWLGKLIASRQHTKKAVLNQHSVNVYMNQMSFHCETRRTATGSDKKNLPTAANDPRMPSNKTGTAHCHLSFEGFLCSFWPFPMSNRLLKRCGLASEWVSET